MATIRAAWKRVIQVKQFESETLELAIEQTDIVSTVTAERLTEAVQDLNRKLTAAGDALILERLQAREPSEPKQAVVRRPANRQDSPPDPKVIETIKKDAPVADTEEPDDYLNL